MMTAPGDKAGDPVVRYRSGPHRKIRGRPDGAYFFRPRAGINTHPRHFLGIGATPRPHAAQATASAIITF
jgi:hypothetical protein